jgi:hypothetical protein
MLDERLANFISTHLEQERQSYEQEVCHILDEYFYPVDRDIRLFIKFDDVDELPKQWLNERVNRLESKIRRRELYLLFQNLFFIQMQTFLPDIELDVSARDLYECLEFLPGLILSKSSWKFYHRFLLIIVLLPTGIIWLLFRNMFLWILCMMIHIIISWICQMVECTKNCLVAVSLSNNICIRIVCPLPIILCILVWFLIILFHWFLWMLGKCLFVACTCTVFQISVWVISLLFCCIPGCDILQFREIDYTKRVLETRVQNEKNSSSWDTI